MSESSHTTQYLAALAACVGALACGTMLGWSAQVQQEITSGDMGFSVSTLEFSWIGSLATLGAACICIPTGILITALGRKLTMLLLTIPFTIGWTIMILAQNALMLMVARFLTGLSGGAFCVAAPVYCSEIAQKEVRGIIGTFFQLLLTIGVLFSFVLGAFVKCVPLSIACAAVPLIFAIVFIFMPESPMYLVSKGNPEAALKSLQWLRGKDYDCTAELNEMKVDDARTKENQTSVAQGLCRRTTLKALGMSVMLMLLQQLAGINAVVFYSTSIFEDAKVGLSGSVCTIILGAVMVVATFVSLFIIDSLGRRFLLLISAFCDGLCTLAIGVYFYMKDQDPESVKSLNWLPITGVLLFIVMFSVGLGPVPWLYMAEVFTPDVKGVAGAIAGTTNWLGAFIITKMFLIMQDVIGAGPSFWFFSVVAFLGTAFVFLKLPETKGKTFAEILADFE